MQMKQPEEFNIQIPQIKEHRKSEHKKPEHKKSEHKKLELQISKIVKKQIRKQSL